MRKLLLFLLLSAPLLAQSAVRIPGPGAPQAGGGGGGNCGSGTVTANSNGSAATSDITTTLAVSAGDLVLVTGVAPAVLPTGVSDSASNTWTSNGNGCATGPFGCLINWYSIISTGGTLTFHLTHSGNIAMGLIVTDFGSGCTALDAAGSYGTATSGTVFTSSSITTSAASGKGVVVMSGSSYYGNNSGANWTAGNINGTAAAIPANGSFPGLTAGDAVSGAVEYLTGQGTFTGTCTLSQVGAPGVFGAAICMSFK